MRLGFISLSGRGATDAFLMRVAGRLADAGLRLAGTVQSNTDRPGRQHCDMDLRVLPDGPLVRISETRGELARGCRLDTGALEQTVADVLARLPGAEILIVNKFGKREAEGKGLIPAIVAALDAGIPVLVGVNGLNLPAFRAFAGGLETALPADPAQVAAWCRAPARAAA